MGTHNPKTVETHNLQLSLFTYNYVYHNMTLVKKCA